MTGIKEDKQVLVKAQAKENTALGFNAAQAATFNAMNDMSIALSAAGDKRRNELRPFYQMNTNTAGKALQEIGASETPHMAALVQQNTLAGRVISDRLSTAFSLQPVQVNVPVNHLADNGKKDGLKVNMELPVAQDNNAWVKFTKNWGDLDGGASYHGQAISGGYDRRLNKNWRGGVFLSYQAMSLGAASSSGNIYDTRLGLYAGYHKNAADAYLYADYGWIRNKMQRSLGMMGLGAEAKYDAHLLEIGGVLPTMLVPAIILFAMSWWLDILSMGETEARSLGANINVIRNIAIACATLMTASSVCISGTIGWVGLVIPHFARMCVGPNNTKLIPTAGLMGGIFMLLVDTATRTLTVAEMPVSILTGLIGAPFYALLLYRQRRTIS